MSGKHHEQFCFLSMFFVGRAGPADVAETKEKMPENPKTETITPALLTIPQVCRLLNIARPTFYKLSASGAFGLLPVKLGACRKVLYQRAEIEAWLQADCPPRKRWQEMRKSQKIA